MANARDGSLDPSTSMVLEKALVGSVPDRTELLQHVSLSERVPLVLAPDLTPTDTHGAITSGEIAMAESHRASA